jgi:hypothetical protein
MYILNAFIILCSYIKYKHHNHNILNYNTAICDIIMNLCHEINNMINLELLVNKIYISYNIILTYRSYTTIHLVVKTQPKYEIKLLCYNDNFSDQIMHYYIILYYSNLNTLLIN